ncbi:MAG: FtsX-like permease family protein [bacterium]|nr:FtsX-like permease family protein [bacterium]
MKSVKKSKCPGIFISIFQKLTTEREIETLTGDFEELYERALNAHGKIYSFFWFAALVIKLTPSIIYNKTYWSIAMFKNYLKVTFRSFKRQKGYTFINISGLTLGFTCFILIMLYVQFETSYDSYHRNKGQIYRIINNLSNYTFTAPPLASILKDEYPEIINIARISEYGISTTDKFLFVTEGRSFLENNLFMADPEILDILTYSFLKGGPGTALGDPNSIILTKSLADKFFGDEEPLGKVINLEGSKDFVVTAVIEDIPGNSIESFRALIHFENFRIMQDLDLTSWGWNFVQTYCTVRDDADITAMEERSNAILIERRDNNEVAEWNQDDRLYFYPYAMQYINPPGGGGPKAFLMILSSVAFIILIIACVNYINLTAARSVKRIKDVGIRKVVGAHRKQLIKQVFTETSVDSIFAFLISLIIVILILPKFSLFVDRSLSIEPMFKPVFILELTALVLFVSLLSGSYPALYISSFRPIMLLRGSFSRSNKGSTLKNFLVVFQSTVSIILIICTLGVIDQLDYIKNKDTGYNKDQVVALLIRDKKCREKFELVINELSKNPNIIAASASSHLPNSIYYSSSINWTGQTEEDVRVSSNFGMADFDFADVYGIEIVTGRTFSKDIPSDRNGAFLINEAAVKALGWEDPIGREIEVWSGTGKIVGVMKDFIFQSFRREIRPLSIFLNPNMQSDALAFQNRNNYYMSVKIKAGTVPETLDYLEDQMKVFSPEYPFEFHFFDDIFRRMYRNDEITGELFGVFSLISIMICCLGLFGLVTFMTELRIKEIGVRRVFGASVSKIVFMISKDFIKWVFFSSVIAFPVSWFVMNSWLEDFAYRTVIGPGVFISALLIAIFFYLFSTCFRSYKAATVNPIDSLRYE